VPVPILRVSRTAVFGHHVVRVLTSDGRLLELSPGHPTADGHTFADLRAGNHLDGVAIASVDLVPYSPRSIRGSRAATRKPGALDGTQHSSPNQQ